MRPRRLSLALCWILFACGTARAGTILLSPADDRNINDLNGDLVADTLGPQHDGFLRVFGAGAAFRAALEFDVSAIPTGSIVDSATLALHDRGSTFNTPFTISLWGFVGDGLVSVADGNAITPFNFVGSFTNSSDTGDPDYLLDVTSFVQFFVTNGHPFAGLLLSSSGEGGLFRGNDLASSEFGDPGARPGLTVTFTRVPEPHSLALLSTGAVVASLLRRRHSRR